MPVHQLDGGEAHRVFLRHVWCREVPVVPKREATAVGVDRIYIAAVPNAIARGDDNIGALEMNVKRHEQKL